MGNLLHREMMSALVLAVTGSALLQGCLDPAADSDSTIAGPIADPGMDDPATAEDALEPFDPVQAATIARTKLGSEVTGESAPQAAACGTAGSTATSVRVNDVAIDGAAKQRSGSSTSCAAPGVLQPTDDALYFCWTLGNDGFTWTYAQNLRTGVRGWTRDVLLRDFGAGNRCPGL